MTVEFTTSSLVVIHTPNENENPNAESVTSTAAAVQEAFEANGPTAISPSSKKPNYSLAKQGRLMAVTYGTKLHINATLLPQIDVNSLLHNKLSNINATPDQDGTLLLSESECVELLTHLKQVEKQSGLSGTLDGFVTTVERAKIRPLKLLANAPRSIALPKKKEVEACWEQYWREAPALPEPLQETKGAHYFPAVSSGERCFVMPTKVLPNGAVFMLCGLIAIQNADGTLSFADSHKWRWENGEKVVYPLAPPK